jgi:hypothetical protein
MTKRDLTSPPPLADENRELECRSAGEQNFLPVPRQPRADGWTPDAQRRFIEALADSGSVTQAARVAGKSVTSCYRLRRAPGAEGFAAAWDSAIGEASRRLIDIAFDRAVNGSEWTELDGEGRVVRTLRRPNDRLLMFLLRAHYPLRYARLDRFRGINDDPPPTLPIAEALDDIEPD